MASNRQLSPECIELLKKSFNDLAVDPDGATMALFQRLFELDPKLRFLFPEELNDHKHRLMSMIGYIVRRCDRWDRVEPRIRNLGLRHVSYGTRPADYRTFEQAMLDVLKERLDLAEGSETLKAWTSLFEMVSASMIHAAEFEGMRSMAPEPA